MRAARVLGWRPPRSGERRARRHGGRPACVVGGPHLLALALADRLDQVEEVLRQVRARRHGVCACGGGLDQERLLVGGGAITPAGPPERGWCAVAQARVGRSTLTVAPAHACSARVRTSTTDRQLRGGAADGVGVGRHARKLGRACGGSSGRWPGFGVQGVCGRGTAAGRVLTPLLNGPSRGGPPGAPAPRRAHTHPPHRVRQDGGHHEARGVRGWPRPARDGPGDRPDR